jgi:hypothetical protein
LKGEGGGAAAAAAGWLAAKRRALAFWALLLELALFLDPMGAPKLLSTMMRSWGATNRDLLIVALHNQLPTHRHAPTHRSERQTKPVRLYSRAVGNFLLVQSTATGSADRLETRSYRTVSCRVFRPCVVGDALLPPVHFGARTSGGRR